MNLLACDNKESEQNSRAESMGKTACDLLTENDVSNAIGQKVVDAGHYTDYDCKYKTVEEPGRMVILRMTMPAFNVSPEQALTNHVKTMKAGLAEDENTYKYATVSDVGDLAITEEHLGTSGSLVLVVFKSVKAQGKNATTTLTIQLVDFEKEKASQYAKALALKALQHV